MPYFSHPTKLPGIEEGDAGKVLTVKSDESGYEHAEPAVGPDVVPIGAELECPSRFVPLLNESNMPKQKDDEADPDNPEEAYQFPVWDMGSLPDGTYITPETPGGGFAFQRASDIRARLGIQTLNQFSLRFLQGKLNGSGTMAIAARTGFANLAAMAEGNASPVVATVDPSWVNLTGDPNDDYNLYILEVVRRPLDIE